MSGKDIRDSVGLLLVVASMVFVGFEIRQNTIAARSAAYMEIGIATSEWHDRFDDRLNRLWTEGSYAESLDEWTLGDWERFQRMTISGLRLFETVLLQVEQ